MGGGFNWVRSRVKQGDEEEGEINKTKDVWNIILSDKFKVDNIYGYAYIHIYLLTSIYNTYTYARELLNVVMAHRVPKSCSPLLLHQEP